MICSCSDLTYEAHRRLANVTAVAIVTGWAGISVIVGIDHPNFILPVSVVSLVALTSLSYLYYQAQRNINFTHVLTKSAEELEHQREDLEEETKTLDKVNHTITKALPTLRNIDHLLQNFTDIELSGDIENQLLELYQSLKQLERERNEHKS